MRLSSTGLAVIVATYYASCVVRSTAAPTPAIVSGELQNALHSPGESLHGDKRLLRASNAAGNRDEGEERGIGGWFSSKLSAGAETLSRKQLKKLLDGVVKDPMFYDNLVMADLTKRYEVYSTWKGLNIDPTNLAKRMSKAGYGGDDYKRFVDDYIAFLASDVRIQ